MTDSRRDNVLLGSKGLDLGVKGLSEHDTQSLMCLHR